MGLNSQVSTNLRRQIRSRNKLSSRVTNMSNRTKLTRKASINWRGEMQGRVTVVEEHLFVHIPTTKSYPTQKRFQQLLIALRGERPSVQPQKHRAVQLQTQQVNRKRHKEALHSLWAGTGTPPRMHVLAVITGSTVNK